MKTNIQQIILLTLMLISVLNCKKYDEISPLEKALSSNHPKIKRVMDSLDKHEVQILFTEVLRGDDSIVFKDYEFQVNDSNYFYPASTVKFPIATLALEKMNEDHFFDRTTTYSIGNDSLISSFENDITKIFTVSDNEAYTRLFEYLGKDDINNRLASKGINARISHRLSGTDPNKIETDTLFFQLGDSLTPYLSNYKNTPIKSLELNKVSKGVGYIYDVELVNEPKDFSKKNYLPITALHGIMKRLMFPEKFKKKERFNLSYENQSFLINTMKILPKDAGYNRDEYYDSYVKFFIYGDTKKNLNDDFTIYNKVGYAYGYLTDCAYIINNTNNKRYILTATIHVNDNQIYNDDNYEYDTIGIPFLAELGRQLVVQDSLNNH